MAILTLIGSGLYAAAGMFWEILWALVLGFALSGIVMTFVPKRRLVRLLGRPDAKGISLALFFGAISSSCSYAAASMTRSLFRKGAHIIPALAFLLASTNLVIELSAVLWTLMGWQFVAAEFVGGFIVVLVMAALMRLFGPLRDFAEKQKQLTAMPDDRAHGHGGPGLEEETADPRTIVGWRIAARAAVMEWRMIWKDIVLGVVIAGFLMALVPDRFWQSLFLQSAPGTAPGALQIVENAFVGPLVSVVSFVCSVGNIPLASVLYRGGITFGGTISFIYADLIIIPLILVYRKYLGWRLALWITAIFYFSMVTTGIAVELLFRALGWIPPRPPAMEMQAMRFFSFNYTFWLNLAFLAIGAILLRLARGGEGGTESRPSCCHHG